MAAGSGIGKLLVPVSARTLNIRGRELGQKKNAATRRPLIAHCLALPTPGQIFDDTKEAVGFCPCLESTVFCRDAMKRAADSE